MGFSRDADPEDRPEPAEAPVPAPQPWPDVDPGAIETKHFMIAGDVPGGQVAVTVSDGPVSQRGAPDDLLARVIQQVGNAINEVGNLIARPLVVRAEAFASMTVVFGEDTGEEAQTQIPYYPPVWRAGETIARLIQTPDEDVFGYARSVGAGAKAYADLAHLVESEGITLDWETRALPPQRLDRQRAARHYRELARPAELRERELEIDGLLYRVIYEGKGHGRAGIRLSKASAVPPRHRGRMVIVRYDQPEIEDAIIHNLIGQPVTATVSIAEATPGTSIVPPDLPWPTVQRIVAGGHYDPEELFDEVDELGT
jgi:hypothetical protein